MVSKRTQLLLWLMLASIWPLTTFWVYQYERPVISGQYHDIIAFLLLMCIVAYFPIIVNETPVFFIQGISLTVFLFFGLFVEMVLTQIAVLFLLYTLRISLKELHRIPSNLLMFLGISVISGIVYKLIGGTNGVIDLSSPIELVRISVYGLVIFLSNHILLWMIQKVVSKRDVSFFSKDSFWEGLTTLLLFPVGLVLYLLYTQMGTVAIIFVGIPFVSLSLIMKLYYSSQRMNDYLQQTSDIGHQLTERMRVDEVLDLFMQKVTELLPVDYAYLIDVNEKKQMELLRYYEGGQETPLSQSMFKRNDGICNRVLRANKGVLFSKRKEWRYLSKGLLPVTVESVIAVPVHRNLSVVGVVLLASKQKRAYEKYQFTIVDILTNYLAVAIENAKQYEETKQKSERCALTNLYNYRYFEELLFKSFERLRAGNYQTLSLIMLDLDHFKSVNDTYGHQSGNVVLCEVAHRLTQLIGEAGTVARYGGEEFVVIMPDTNREQTYIIAERIRTSIANKAFLLEKDVSLTRKKTMIRVTASIGFATAPIDADDPLALVRHADRAMYTGAKQKGRNKVAAYGQ